MTESSPLYYSTHVKLWNALCLFLLACGGGSATTEERICEAASECGALDFDEIESCVDTLEETDADRALRECADCLQQNMCADIAAGSCIATCGQFAGAFSGDASGLPPDTRIGDLSGGEVEVLCQWLIERSGGPGEHDCSASITLVIGTVSECIANYSDSSCNDTVADYEACYQSIDEGDACQLLVAPACQSLSC